MSRIQIALTNPNKEGGLCRNVSRAKNVVTKSNSDVQQEKFYVVPINKEDIVELTLASKLKKRHIIKNSN